ncbi:MAG: hypothetical protein M1822_005053 [Bathelium mastoideum]|nr:MAG: hypothetical protein M1822_005053 [Bathelium mastoideum]
MVDCTPRRSWQEFEGQSGTGIDLVEALSQNFRSEVDEDDVISRLRHAEDAQEALIASRASGAHRALHNGGKLIACAHKFLEEYQGLIDIVKGVDSRFGAIAVGIVRVAFQVPDIKRKHEAEVSGTLETLSSYLEQARRLHGVQRDNAVVQKWAQEVCRLISQLADYAFQYFTSKRQPVFQSSKDLIAQVAEKIKFALYQLKNEILAEQASSSQRAEQLILKIRKDKERDDQSQLRSLLDIKDSFNVLESAKGRLHELDGKFSAKRRLGQRGYEVPTLQQISMNLLKEDTFFRS